MENAMELPLMTRVIVLIGCAIFFGLICTWSVVWAWLMDRVKGVGKLTVGRGQHLATAMLRTERHLLSGVEKHLFSKPKRPKAV
jgi:hypothetical protein